MNKAMRPAGAYLVVILGLGIFSLGNAAYGEVLRWEYTGRLMTIFDPDQMLSDVRLGDPVSGFLQIDTTLSPFDEREYLGGLARFQALSFEVTNPRNGEILRSPPAFQNPPVWFAFDVSNSELPNPGPEFLAGQFFESENPEDPEGGPSAFFEGSRPVPDDGVPTPINLDDTTLDYELGEAALFAVVFQLTPVAIPFGDLDTDLQLDQADIDTLALALSIESQNEFYDLNDDGVVDSGDHKFWIAEIANTIPGDTNLDGSVDFADFLVLSSNFGMTGGWAEGNFDLEPAVAFSDFLLLSSNFGAGSSSESVPGPSGFTHMIVAVLGLFASRIRFAMRGIAKL